LLPSALEACRRTGIKPSKLLIPVAYGSLLGGVATYFTTANIIVSDLLAIARPPQARLNVLAFTPTGGLIAVAGILFLALLGRRLLPDREPSHAFHGMRPTGSDLEDLYQLGERLWEGVVQPGSPHADRKLADAAIGEKLGVTVVAVLRNNHVTFSPQPDQLLHAGDVLWIVGREDRVCQLEEEGLSISKSDSNEHISALGLRFIEVLLSPRSKAQGRTLKDMAFRSQFGLTAIALQRKERTFRTNVANLPLEPGDSLLMASDNSQFIRLRNDPDFIVLESSPNDQPVQPREAAVSIGVVLTAITASILGVPVYLAMLSGAIVLILSGIINAREAYESVEWHAVFLIAGMYTASLAMVQTGLAGFAGRLMISLVTPLGPLGLAAGAYLLTALLTQVMGGQVTALVTGPIAISAAIDLHVSAQAIAVATAIGCSASFFTPLAHPVNILMIGPANYKFNDFFKVGWALTLVCFMILMVGMAIFWKL
jgi:di/tricarboxylate transporter